MPEETISGVSRNGLGHRHQGVPAANGGSVFAMRPASAADIPAVTTMRPRSVWLEERGLSSW
jgi:hypothetical protein